MNSVDRFKKRKKIIGSISVYESVDEELVNEFLNSEINKSKVEASFKIVDEHYDFKYDFTVSKDEAKEFLEQFKKDFNQERFDKLVIDCRKEVINSIVTPFGLGKIVAAYDKDGGNVTTTHNFEKGITATNEDKDRYNEWQNSVNNKVDRTIHDEVKDKWKKDTYQAMVNGESVIDGYTGKTLGQKTNNRIDKNVSIHGEHITAVSEIEKDARNHLFADGKTASERLQDRANLSGNENNLTLIEGGMNSSKNDADLKEWKNSKVSKKHAEETGNPDMTNAEYYNLDDKRIKEAYDKSKNFITKTQLKKQVIKQGKELVSTGALESAKMGIQQAIGLIMSEFFTALFDEILDIYKNGFSNGFEDDRFFSVLKERIIRIAKKIQAKWKDVVVAFKDGLLSGFISNFVTTMVNIFATTWKRFVRIIREGIFSLFKAIKILIFPPEDLTFTDVMHEAKKIIATGLMVSLGVLLEEAVSNFFKGIPFSNILTSVFVGALTGIAITMTVYYIDKKKNDKDAINQMIKETDEKFENVEMLLNKLSLY